MTIKIGLYKNHLFILVFIFSDHPVISVLVCHFAGIVALYLLQASVNLIGSPLGCRVHGSETLEGFDMGSYIEKPVRIEPNKQEDTTTDP